jgi:homocysteine S-methyltransferase
LLDVLVQALRPFVDHWQGETLSTIAEARLLREVIGNDAKPLWVSFTLSDTDEHGDTPCLRSGETVEQAVRVAAELGIEAVLFNCSQPEVMGAAVTVAVQTLAGIAPGVRVGVYANAFPPMSAEAEANSTLCDIRADLDPEGYLQWARDWVSRGASIVGGCCGIGPEHIARLREALAAG